MPGDERHLHPCGELARIALFGIVVRGERVDRAVEGGGRVVDAGRERRRVVRPDAGGIVVYVDSSGSLATFGDEPMCAWSISGSSPRASL